MFKKALLALLLIALPAVAAYLLWPAAHVNPGDDTDTGYVDMHVHAACIGTGDSGCFISEAMRHGYKFSFYLAAFDVTLEELESEGDVVVIRKLSDKVAASKAVSRAVVLALDGVVDEAGNLDRERTQVYVPNDYLAEAVSAYDNLLFGASINPYRHDALERLQRAKDQGAVLVKWIPGIMHIDPADERIIPFYDRLRELGLPLLTHAGDERSFGDSSDELGDPLLLEVPLRRGVTVIAAHLASMGSVQGDRNFDRLLRLFSKYDNLYADISALTQINRLGYLRRALVRPDLHSRLVYGSDWPLQFFPLVSPWYQASHVPMSELKAIVALDNQWDKDVALKRAMGVPSQVFRQTASLLGITL